MGDFGAVFRFTDQSMNVAVPRMAKTMVSIWSIGTDLMHIARAPVFQSALMWTSRSAPFGFSYTFSAYCAARHKRGYEGMYLPPVSNLHGNAHGMSAARATGALIRYQGAPYSCKGGRFRGSLEFA